MALLRSSGRSIAQVAKELGVSDMSLSSWAREQAKNVDPKEAEQEEATAWRRSRDARGSRSSSRRSRS